MPYIYHKRVRWDNKINLGVNQSVHKLELYKLDPGIYRAFMNSAKPFLPHLILDIYIMLRAPDTRYTYVIMVLINKWSPEEWQRLEACICISAHPPRLWSYKVKGFVLVQSSMKNGVMGIPQTLLTTQLSIKSIELIAKGKNSIR